jgi:excisionase family DNA binding protein
MTMPASAQPFGRALPSSSDREMANQLRRVLASKIQEAGGGEARLKVAERSGGTSELVLSPALIALLMETLRHVGQGKAVTLVPVGEMLTTQQAADILNVSRPFLISLLEKGAIPHHTVGRHRRIRAQDLFVYKRKRDETRERALSELAEIDAALI